MRFAQPQNWVDHVIKLKSIVSTDQRNTSFADREDARHAGNEHAHTPCARRFRASKNIERSMGWVSEYDS